MFTSDKRRPGFSLGARRISRPAVVVLGLLLLTAGCRADANPPVTAEGTPAAAVGGVQGIVTRIVQQITLVTRTPDPLATIAIDAPPAVLDISLTGELPNLDPGLAGRQSQLDLAQNLFVGLTNFNPDTNTIPAVQVGRGTRLAAVQRLHSQGPVEQTSRPLDLAIEGEGFFQVQLPSGALAYTRDGSFGISDTGTLITSNGYAVVPGIKIPTDATEITISSTGKVSVSQSVTQVDKTELGQLELARFMNPSGLQALGENLFAETPASGQPTVGFPSEEGMGRILQGHLEGSNVEIVQEMVDMITSMRAYEINSKAIKNAEEMMSTANNMIR